MPRISFSLVADALVDLPDRVVGQLLDLMLQPLALVLADLVLLLVGLEVIHAVAADVADRDPRFLRILADELGQLLAALLGQLGDRQADHLAVGDRIEAETGGADRLFNRADVRAVPHLHRQHPRFGGRHGRHLVQRHVRAVDLDMDRIEQGSRRAARCAGPQDRASAPRPRHACGA